MRVLIFCAGMLYVASTTSPPTSLLFGGTAKASGSKSALTVTKYGTADCTGDSKPSDVYDGNCKQFSDHWGMLSGNCMGAMLTTWAPNVQKNCGDPILRIPFATMGITGPSLGGCGPEEENGKVKKTTSGQDIYINIQCRNEGTTATVLTIRRFTQQDPTNQCAGMPYETQVIRSDTCFETSTFDGMVEGTCEKGTLLIWGPSKANPAVSMSGCGAKLATHSITVQGDQCHKEDGGTSTKLSCSDTTACTGCHCHNHDAPACSAQPGCNYEATTQMCNADCVGCHCHNHDMASCTAKPECNYDAATQMCNDSKSVCVGCHCHNGDMATCSAKPECNYDLASQMCNSNSACEGCHCHNHDMAACSMKAECKYDWDLKLCTHSHGSGHADMCGQFSGDCGRCSSMPGCKCNEQTCEKDNGEDDLIAIMSPATYNVPAIVLHAALCALSVWLTMWI